MYAHTQTYICADVCIYLAIHISKTWPKINLYAKFISFNENFFSRAVDITK